ncbi:MAG: Hsp20/alpha crystallin family protein [Halobacteria archaeon]|nr:Hsp20/alpha crystallin family protein [Halobacteria archaeon]
MSFFGSTVRKLGAELPPSVDILESDDEVIVLVDLAGYDKQDVEIRLVNDKLKVEAERDKRDVEGYEIVDEGRPESVSHKIPLPSEVTDEEARAEYENGLLRVRLAKEDFGGGTEVEIGSGSDNDDEDGDGDEPQYTRDELEEMSYRELQQVAKDMGVKANIKMEEMVERVAEELGVDD